MKSDLFKSFLVLVLLSGMTYFIYQPGLSGGFLLDDQSVLSKLAIIDHELTAENISNYLMESNTGPLKRPISVLSFLIDGQTWPIEAYSFKQTNLIIHIINGCLLFVLISCVFKHSYQPNPVQQRYLIIAGIATALWLFNPFLVSTTLYVVQRMTMLPVLFSLLGLLLYLKLRLKSAEHRASEHQSKLTAVWYILVVYGAVALAVLSKENGVLLVLFFALFERFICRGYLRLEPLSKSMNWLLIRIPLLLLVLAILIQLPGFIDGYQIRAFSLYERLISEPRALVLYLYHLFVPNYFTEGVFTDTFTHSTGLFTPISTVPSMVCVSALLLVAWLLRKRYIWLSFSIFFFFAAHLLESTVVPLELYFEHRNYLAALFLFVPLSMLAVHVLNQSKIFYLPVVLIIGFFALTTAQRAGLWGDQLALHELSMKQFPHSVRARTLTALQYQNQGQHSQATAIIASGLPTLEHLELRFNLIAMKCYLNQLEEVHIQTMLDSMQTTAFTKNDISAFGGMFDQLVNDQCNHKVSTDTLGTVFKRFNQNEFTQNAYGKSIYLHYLGQFQLIRLADFVAAKQSFTESFELSEDVIAAIDNAMLLKEAGAVSQALALLELVKSSEKNRSIFSFNHKQQEPLDAMIADLKTAVNNAH